MSLQPSDYIRKALFCRKWSYSGVVLVKNVLSADDLPSRSTVAEGYDMVINDLEEALKCIGTEVKDGRFNSWAVKGFTGTCQSI